MLVRVLDFKGLQGLLPLGKTTLKILLPTIPHFKSPGGGKLLFREDEILRWLEQYRWKPAQTVEDVFAEAERMQERNKKRT